MLLGAQTPKIRHGTAAAFLKKSPASNLGNQRPVCCIRTIYKLVSAVINNSMYKLLERYDVLKEQQEGFRAQRSCPRQTHKLVSIIEDAKRQKKKLYCLWIDWGNTFNSAAESARAAGRRARRARSVSHADRGQARPASHQHRHRH